MEVLIPMKIEEPDPKEDEPNDERIVIDISFLLFSLTITLVIGLIIYTTEFQ
jgi:hypothetical protein